MPQYIAPAKEIEFVLFDVLKIADSDIPGYTDLDRGLVSAVVGEVGKIATDIFLPLGE